MAGRLNDGFLNEGYRTAYAANLTRIYMIQSNKCINESCCQIRTKSKSKENRCMVIASGTFEDSSEIRTLTIINLMSKTS